MACAFSTSQLSKVARTCGVLYILTSKCASRHKGAHFLNISTSKSVRDWGVLYILTSKCASATTAYISTSKSDLNAVWFVYILTSKCASRHLGLYFFNIATSKSAPNMVCFVHFDFEMCFAPQWRAIFHLSPGQMAPHRRFSGAYFSTLRSHKSLEKQCISLLSYLFAHLHLLSSRTFSSLISLLHFSSLTLPTFAFPSEQRQKPPSKKVNWGLN